MKFKKLFQALITTSTLFLSTYLLIKPIRNSQLFMPSEYQLIKKIVNKLADNNDLGQREIGFIISAGGVASYYAKDIGLCKRDGKESCAYHSYLNPFKKYPNPKINEILRLSYLSGSGSASASSLGTIAITHSYFRITEGKELLMVCTIAHELAHILNLDTSNDSLRLNEEARDFDDKKREELSAQISRETETNADLYAQWMVLKAGYPTNTCIKKMEHTMQIRYMPKETKLDTHPSIPKRLRALKEELPIQIKAIVKTNENEQTNLRWTYDRDLNMLKFIPNK